MMKASRILVVSLVLFAVIVPLGGQAAKLQTAKKEQAQVAKSQMTKKGQAKTNREINIRGEITGVNYEQKEFRVTTKDKSYLVVATNKTRIVGRFIGQLPLLTLRMGDELAINGRLRDENTIEAKLIRDMSTWKVGLKKRVGVVRELDLASRSIVLAHGKSAKEMIKVKISEDTKILLQVVQGKGRVLTQIKLEDLKVGDRLIVTGVFNKKDQKLDAIQIVIMKKAETPKSLPTPLGPIPTPTTTPAQ